MTPPGGSGVPADEHRRPIGRIVDERARRQFGRRPALIVPVAAANPLAGLGPGARADAPGELLRRVGISEVHVVELRAAVEEMHVRIVEPGQHAPSLGIDDGRLRTAPALHRIGAADVDDAVADDRQGGRGGLRWIASPDVRAGEDEIGGEPRWPRTGDRKRAHEHHRAARDDQQCSVHGGAAIITRP
jgi:hypothetical protein